MNIRRFAENLLRIKGRKSIYFYCLVIGVAAGLGAILFLNALELAEKFTFHFLAAIPLSPYERGNFFGPDLSWRSRIILAVLPVIGGLLVGLILHFLSLEAGGTGTDSMIQAFHKKEGVVDSRVPYYKALATIVTLASGGSAGKEGPTALIGGGFGSMMAGLLNAGARARRTLLLAGTAGGLGAIFCAPFGGALTAVEVIYKEDIESDSLIPCIISSITAYLVFTGITGRTHALDIPEMEFTDYRQLAIYTIQGGICFVFGSLFTRIFHTLRILFHRVRVHLILKPAIGGAFVGLISLIFPQATGTDGFGFLQFIINSEYRAGETLIGVAPAFLFLFIALAKIITTSFTVTSGGSGGIFGPSLFIGGMLGGFVGTIAQFFFPGLQISVASFILVGMGAFFAGVARAPIAAMIMVCDMIGSYKLLPPLIIVSSLAFILAHKISIYRGQVENRFQSPAHFWDMNLDILENLKVGEEFVAYRQEAIAPKNMLLSQLEAKSLDIKASDFIVRSGEDRYHGVISLRKIRLTRDQDLISGLITLDDVDEFIEPVSPDSSLGAALKIILENEVDKVAVVEDGVLQGYVRYSDILKRYHVHIGRE